MVLVIILICDKIKLEDCVVKFEVFVFDLGLYQDEKVGVIFILSFYNNFYVDVLKEINVLKLEEVKVIIVDLCGNGGGLLLEVMLVFGLFIEQGLVVQICYEGGCMSVNQDIDGKVVYQGLFIVLVDCYSVLVLEIFVVVMQDYNCVLIIGE